MRYIIVTGGTKGLGAALVAQFSKNCTVFSIGRSSEHSIIDHIHTIEYDLLNLDGINELMSSIFREIGDDVEGIYLINNAGMLDPIKYTEQSSVDELRDHITLNLVAPMVLTGSFIRYSSVFRCAKRVINISSGAGKKPYMGWGAYCSSKAALDMFTQTTALEQGEDGVQILSLAPGIIDTGMQQLIRSSCSVDFPMRDKFVILHQNNQLEQPKAVAIKIEKLLFSDQFIQGGVVDLRELCPAGSD